MRISGKRLRFSALALTIYTSPRSRSALRLHRPAACAMASNPANERMTASKLISTPASISCELTQIIRSLPNLSLISSKILLRCAGHMAVLK